MVVLIRGMEMPKSCVDCNMPMEWCNKWIGVEDGKRSEDCPFVPVPPHGRLIDADALLQRFYKEQTACEEHGRDFSFSFKSGGELCTEWWSVERFVEDAETIIQSSLDGEP